MVDGRGSLENDSTNSIEAFVDDRHGKYLVRMYVL